jgi:tetratricopeptide (TPR) repeat protein
MGQEDAGRAWGYIEEALTIWRDLEDHANAAIALGNLGNLAWNRGDVKGGRASYEEALMIQRTLGNKYGAAVMLVNLGEIACEQGDFQLAYQRLSDCLCLCRDIGDRRQAAYGFGALAELAQVRGEAGRASRLLGAAVSLREAIGHVLSPATRAEHERRVDELRSSLGEEAFERAFTAGRALSWEQAIVYALEEGGD